MLEWEGRGHEHSVTATFSLRRAYGVVLCFALLPTQRAEACARSAALFSTERIHICAGTSQKIPTFKRSLSKRSNSLLLFEARIFR